MGVLSESPCRNYALITVQRNSSFDSIVFADRRSKSKVVIDTIDYEKLHEEPLWIYWRDDAVVFGSFVVPTTVWDFRRKRYSRIEGAEYSYNYGLTNGVPVRRRDTWRISHVDSEIPRRAALWFASIK